MATLHNPSINGTPRDGGVVLEDEENVLPIAQPPVLIASDRDEQARLGPGLPWGQAERCPLRIRSL